MSKAKSQLAVAESFRTTVDESLEECRAALSHLKEKVSFQPVHLLTPFKVLALFKKMPDEVHALWWIQDGKLWLWILSH